MTARRTLSALALLSLLVAGSAAAQDATEAPSAADDERVAMARALFADGNQAAQEERFEDAAELFRRAYALRPAPAIAFNLASALVRTGHLLQATEHLRNVIGHEETSPGMRDSAQVLLDEVTPRLGRLRLGLTGPTEGLSLRIDERPLDLAVVGVPVPADPGSHTIVATRDEQEVASTEVEIPEGEEVAAELSIPPLPEPEPEPEPEPLPAPIPEGGGDDGLLIGLAVGGAVLALAVAGVVVGVVLADQAGAEAQAIEGTTIPPILEWD